MGNPAMLDNPPLLTIHRGHRRPDKTLVEAFRGAQTSHLVDAMDGRGAVDYRIKPMDPANAAFVGPALTAFSYPADVVGVYGALAEAEPGTAVARHTAEPLAALGVGATRGRAMTVGAAGATGTIGVGVARVAELGQRRGAPA